MIIDRYLVREVGLPFLAVSGVLLLVLFTYSLTRHLMDASAGLLFAGEVLRLSLLRSLVALEVILPLGFYLAVMIAMGRLYSDSEIYAMRSGGIGEARLLRPVMAFALVLALLAACLSTAVRPWAYQQSYRIRAEAMAGSEVDRVRAARFYRSADSDRTVFIDSMQPDSHEVGGVFIRSRGGGDLQVITSASGRLEPGAAPGAHRLTLYDARLYRRVADGPDVFAELGSLALWLPAGEVEPVGYRTKASPTGELRRAAAGPEIAEYQWRLSTPASTLLLALLSMPLSRGRPRQGRYGRILLALAIYAVYFNLLDMSRSWVEQGTARQIWWVPGLLLALVTALYFPWRRLRGRGRNPA